MADVVTVFISYSHKDTDYLEEDSLLGFLQGLERENVRFWSDRHIRTGECWDAVIKANLQTCDVALALVSQAFLDSPYCQDVEIRELLAQRKYLFPIILSACDWQNHDWLRRRQFLPGGDKTLEERYTDPGRRKRLFLEIRKQLHQWVVEFTQTSTPDASSTGCESSPASAYSAKTRFVFCRRLGDSWRDLADYFDISLTPPKPLTAEWEARAIWKWLDQSHRLGELPEALEFLGCEDLATELFATPSASAPVAAPAWEGSPYPGLQHFTPEDASIFFGRAAESQELLARLADPANRFLAVVGASGSGKSSLVAAGVIPRLNEIPGGQDWLWLRFTPGGLGNDPFLTLAAKLEPFLERRGWLGREIAELLRTRGELAELADLLLADQQKSELLLFIDQFEELFTLTDAAHHPRFIAMLAKAAEAQRVRLVLTLRADFYHHSVAHPRLARLLRLGSYPLAASDSRALLEMITRPAAVAGLRFEEELPWRILEDTGREPGALALMAFALAQLYKQKANGTLTKAAYHSFGGVKGVIGKQADATFAELSSAVQAKLGAVFRELVEVDERGEATRRRALLEPLTDSVEAKRLVSALTDARLLVTSRGKDNTAIVEVAHEALLRSWPRLRNWIDKTRDDLRLRRQITQAAAEWQEHDRAEKYRWPDERVVEAADMLAHLGLDVEELSQVEQDFLGPLNPELMLEEIADPATQHERRATIGVRLALLGDPRPGVGLRENGLPDIVWYKVRGGKVTLEEEAGTFSVKSFYIAKYPVTWAQYRAFLEAEDGFGNPAWWEGLWFQIDKPGKQFNRYDNHPAENLCWLEAVAFCRWLSARLGYEIRLPTEWEWQRAATGGNPDNVYPWGAEWDNDCANTYESELSRSTAVGVYPQGASSVGALDMSGNVYEWCLNEYDNPESTEVLGEGRRVVRGGSWFGDPGRARAAFRGWSDPNGRDGYVGLRVACLAPIFLNR